MRDSTWIILSLHPQPTPSLRLVGKKITSIVSTKDSDRHCTNVFNNRLHQGLLNSDIDPIAVLNGNKALLDDIMNQANDLTTIGNQVQNKGDHIMTGNKKKERLEKKQGI
jgi:hypothetical protein